MKMMKALWYEAAGKGSITEIPYPECGDSQVIVKVMSAAICKWAELNHNTIGGGGKLAKYPVVTGHEFAGYVEEIGKDVTNCKIGDRVVIDNAFGCGKCYNCLRGDSLHCENFISWGHNRNGGFAQYSVVEEKQVHLIPDGISFDDASITEPLACCIHAMDVIDLKQGENVITVGMGPHGLMLAQLCEHSNAAKAVAIGTHQWSLDWLDEVGCTTVLAHHDDYSIHEKALEELFPHGVDAIIDAAGSWPMTRSLWKFLRPNGRYMQYGSYHSNKPLDMMPGDLNNLHFSEQKFIGCSCQVNCFPRALEALDNGIVSFNHLVTHTFDLDDYFEALECNRTDKSTIKVVIHPNGNPEE